MFLYHTTQKTLIYTYKKSVHRNCLQKTMLIINLNENCFVIFCSLHSSNFNFSADFTFSTMCPELKGWKWSQKMREKRSTVGCEKVVYYNHRRVHPTEDRCHIGLYRPWYYVFLKTAFVIFEAGTTCFTFSKIYLARSISSFKWALYTFYVNKNVFYVFICEKC